MTAVTAVSMATTSTQPQNQNEAHEMHLEGTEGTAKAQANQRCATPTTVRVWLASELGRERGGKKRKGKTLKIKRTPRGGEEGGELMVARAQGRKEDLQDRRPTYVA